ncbi:MAG: hypothetical protein HYX84_01380 [Chloroflexi bacterium]|nr:hypothetical protein [Chloroflexota bacterium]
MEFIGGAIVRADKTPDCPPCWWLIEPDGWGRCKKCGEVREFPHEPSGMREKHTLAMAARAEVLKGKVTA